MIRSFLRPVLVLVCLVLLGKDGSAQVEWKFTGKKIKENVYEIRLSATVDEPWHIYSQSSPKGGPLPTTIVFSKNPLVTMNGKVKEEGEMEMYHDEIFDVDVYSYTDKVDFVQLVTVKGKVKTVVNGTVEFMACTKEQCLTPQKVKFSVKLE